MHPLLPPYLTVSSRETQHSEQIWAFSTAVQWKVRQIRCVLFHTVPFLFELKHTTHWKESKCVVMLGDLSQHITKALNHQVFLCVFLSLCFCSWCVCCTLVSKTESRNLRAAVV